tara:strand:- start:6456 stop:7553 length:1098 start_codon:yes stop_codon:yes gene_type:complete
MARLFIPNEINFKTGESEETLDACLGNIKERIYSLKIPYAGGKRSVFDFIFKSIDNQGIEFDSILDLFAGSCAVSLGCKMLNKSIVSNDLSRSSYANAMAFVVNNDIVLTDEQIDFLLNNDNKNKSDFILTNYRKRFTEGECVRLDNFRANAEELSSPGEILFELAMASMCILIMQHCYVGGRLNCGQALANLQHRIGHQRNRGGTIHFNNFPKSNFRQVSNKNVHEAYNMDALDMLNMKPDVDLAYIDPPYGGSQSDYAFIYKFFDEFYLQEDMGNRCKDKDDPSSKFASANDYQEHFELILQAASYIPVLAISYNERSSWKPPEEIREILLQFRDSVEVASIEHYYKYRKKKNKEKELLFIAS